MASSKKLPENSVLQHQLKATLIDVFTQKKLVNSKLVLALSGGLDSTVLLNLLAEVNKTLPFQLSAHHVHHGLSKNADAWADFCAETCKKLHIPLTISNVKVNKNSGLGVEATAREARYEALLSSDADFVCLAHHQDDQAETLLLQLARGAGVKGLAGMAMINDKLLRPLLDAPRSRIEAYAKQHNLTWIEDESNADTQFDRNFMRHEILPTFAKQYPAVRLTISRAAQHMAEANMLLDEMAVEDVKSCQLNQMDRNNLLLAPLALLSKARVKNAMRFWLLQHGGEAPSAAQLQQITQQLFHAKSDASIKIKLSASLILRRFQGRAYVLKESKNIDLDFQQAWRGENEMILPDNSRLIFSQNLGAGIALRHLENSRLIMRYRQGGETLKPVENRPNRSLKSIFQTSNIPPWQRTRLPLLCINNDLVMLPNTIVDVRFKAAPNELGLTVIWQDN